MFGSRFIEFYEEWYHLLVNRVWWLSMIWTICVAIKCVIIWPGVNKHISVSIPRIKAGPWSTIQPHQHRPQPTPDCVIKIIKGVNFNPTLKACCLLFSDGPVKVAIILNTDKDCLLKLVEKYLNIVLIWFQRQCWTV